VLITGVNYNENYNDIDDKIFVLMFYHQSVIGTTWCFIWIHV